MCTATLPCSAAALAQLGRSARATAAKHVSMDMKAMSARNGRKRIKVIISESLWGTAEREREALGSKLLRFACRWSARRMETMEECVTFWAFWPVCSPCARFRCPRSAATLGRGARARHRQTAAAAQTGGAGPRTERSAPLIVTQKCN
jgi:hypothetical protein